MVTASPLTDDGPVVADDGRHTLTTGFWTTSICPRGLGAVADDIVHRPLARRAHTGRCRFKGPQPHPAALVDRGLDPLALRLDRHPADQHTSARGCSRWRGRRPWTAVAPDRPCVGDRDRRRARVRVLHCVDPHPAGEPRRSRPARHTTGSRVPAPVGVIVRTPVSRLVSTVSEPTGWMSPAGWRTASGSPGSAPGMSLPSGSIWIGLPTTPRTTSGWVVGLRGRVSVRPMTSTSTPPLVGSPRPSLTR